MSNVKTLRIIAARQLQSHDKFPEVIECSAFNCANKITTPWTTHDSIFCHAAYKCSNCAKYYHSEHAFTIFIPDKTHCICYICSKGFGIGTGPLKLDEKYIGIDQCIWIDNDAWNNPLPPAVGCLYSVNDTDRGTEYKFNCVLRDLPDAFSCICPFQNDELTEKDEIEFSLTVIKKINSSDVMVNIDLVGDIQYFKHVGSDDVEMIKLEHNIIAKIFIQVPVKRCFMWACPGCGSNEFELCYDCKCYPEKVSIDGDKWLARHKSLTGEVKLWYAFGQYEHDMFVGTEIIDEIAWYCFKSY